MTRTSPLTLALLAGAGAVAGFLLDYLLTIMARPTFVPSTLLPIMLVLLAAGVVAAAWPVRRAVRNGTGIDPFRAVRVAMLARAASLLGALLAGFGLGLALFLLSRPVMPQVGSMAVIVALMASAAVLAGAALVAEQLCTLPKDPDDRQPDDSERGAGPAR